MAYFSHLCAYTFCIMPSRAVFGLEMIEELRRHGYSIGPGTLYPILHNLEKSGCLRAKQQIVMGKRRKNYVATAKGKHTLEELRKRYVRWCARY